MDVVDHLTRFVLVNAIYFKGEWEHRFDRTMTRDAPFDTGGGQIIRVPMMFANERLSYLAWDEAQAIELPYRGRDLSMVILLPRSHDGLVKLERRLTAEKLTEWLARLSAISPRKVPTYLPKFKTTSSFSLAPSLSKMGMTRAFTTAADFSGIDGNKDLFLAAAVHKVFVEVNEDGTEAAAATGVVGARHKGEEATIFKADHPFVFLIKDRQTGLILFFGRIVNPKQEALM
jgi:serpin B